MVIGTKNCAMASAGTIFWIFMITLRSTDGVQYLGKFIGKLSELQHDVSGEVYAVDARTLHIKGLTYDGQGPAAFFFVGDTKVPSSAGYKLRDEQGRADKLRRYNGESITLTLPEGKTLGNIKWLSIWCEEFSVNFGDVKIPSNFDFPRPQRIEPLSGVHGISSDEIVIVDAQTLLIPHLSYDGQAPDAKFWAGRGPKPSPQGIRIPDENGKETPLRKYDRKTVVLTLPGDLTVFDIGHFGIWCEQFTVDFGHVQIPSTLNIPPSLKMLGVSPQSKLNCEILLDERAFEVRWAVAGESIVLQLVAKLEDGEYMSFGLSGEDHASIMIGGDVVVAWVNKETLKGYADDYYLGDKSQCAGYTGSCPDQLLQDGTDTVRVLNAALVNGYSIVTYQRTLNPHDRFDRAIYTNQSQPIIWAIGPLDSRNLVSYHSKYAKGNHFIDFGRPPKWNCPNPDSEQSRSAARRKPKEHPHQRNDHRQKQQQQAQQSQQQPQQQQPQPQQKQQRVYDEPSKSTEYEVPQTTPQPVSRKNQRRRGEARRRVVNNQNQAPVQPEAQAVNQEVERINPAPSTRSKQTINPATEELESPNNQPPPRSRQNRRRNNGDRHEPRNRPRVENVEREDVSEVQQRSIPTPAPVSLGKIVPWTIPPIQCYEPEDGVFYAQMGPAGSRKGYSAITGHVGWGIAWYINGLLIPEINVVRGKTYTFVTEGGNDENFNAKYHPFYITDDPVGGYAYKTEEERMKVHIFAGAEQLNNGTIRPTGTGRLCHWSYKGDLDPDDFPSFGAFQRHLELKCEVGEPGFVQWTPTKMTPDTVYYQCFTHRYLGWKINVLDSCDELSQGSEFHPAILPPPAGFKETQEDDLETDASYRVATVVKLPSGSKNEPERIKNYALDNHKNITDDSRPLFDTTQTQPMYVSHPNTLNSEIITKPLFYAAFEIPNRMTPVRPTPSMEPANPSVIYNNKSHFKLDVVANNISRSRQHPKPSKSRLHLISRPTKGGGSQHRKRSHVVKKVIKFPKDMLMSEQRQNAVISKRPVLKLHRRPNVNFPRNKSRPEKEIALFMTKTKEPIVELSPIQPSTEKLIEDFLLLSKYSKLQKSLRKTTETPPTEKTTDNNNKHVHFIPTALPELNTTTLEFAVNTGFNPHSIVFERGFTPIMTERTKTITDIKGPEIENESEIGMLDIPASSVANLTHKNFINHRYDDSLDNVKPFEIRKKRQKSNLGQYLPYEDSMPQSAENSKSYYLPPTGEKKKPGSNEPSSSIFITYDGKKIHGSTLTSAGVDNGQSVLKSAKTAELLRSKPQFAPFKGDLPPLDPNIINSFGAKTQQATLNRGLETPRSGDSNNGVTKLKLVPQRSKRYAHHTPEHTAEQMASAKNATLINNSSGAKTNNLSFIISVFSAIVILISYQ